MLSAIADTTIFSFNPNLAISPKSHFSGEVKSIEYGCSWAIRKGTDDIYNILPHREGDVNELICSTLEPGNVFIDVGANIGYYTIIASQIVGAAGRVIAFEPMPKTFYYLENNCKLNYLKNVIAIPKAAWSNESTKSLLFSGGYYGMASLTKSEGHPVSIMTVPLDKVCEPYSNIKMIKIDAEGSEHQILRGAKTTLKRTQYLVLECSEECDKITALLQENGFTIRKLAFTTYVLAERR